MRVRFFITLVLIKLVLSINAQTISVASFKLLETDLTANTVGTMMQDQNGETAALIKVVTTQTGFTFDGGALGIVKIKQTPGEVWVYVPRGSKKITIKHPQLGVLRDYYYPMTIEPARTYEMVLTTGSVQTIIKQAANSQYLVLKVTPIDAVVELDNEILPTSEGIAQKFVKLGTYEYQVQAPNYHTSAGKVTIDDPNNKKVLEISLSPAFGWIEVRGDKELEGAQVFIDNALAGTIPMKSNNLASGKHNVKVVKSLYQPYSQTVEVSDNQTTQITPQLNTDYSIVTINVANDAEIYVNNEKKGSGTWTGKLGTGTYLLEAKKEGHQSTTINVDISSKQPQRTINLNAPIPIYGSVNITSTPSMADIYVDGKNVGQTPLYLPQLLIGKHNVAIKHNGYGDYESEFEIKESQTATISTELKNQVLVKVKANTTTASIYIDGNFIGKGSVEITQTIGKHLIEVKDDSRYYINYKENILFQPANNIIDVYLEEKSREVTFCYDYKPHINKYIFISIDGGDFFTWGDNEKKYTYMPVETEVIDEFKKTLTTGKHEIVVRHQGTEEIRQTIDVNHKNNIFKISFKKRMIEPCQSE